MTTKVTASVVYKEYQIAATTSPTAGQLLAIANPTTGRQRVILEAVTGRVVFKFGTSTVAADATVTSNALADGNFSVAAGAIVEVDLPTGTLHNYVSVVTATGSGTAIVKLAKAEQ